MYEIPKEFLDIYGNVLPNPKCEDKPSDNGVLFTSIAKILGFDFPNYKEMIRSCYLEKGLIARWPGNNFDQAAWDDYMAVAVASICFNIKDIPREILWYGIKHAFIFNTDNKLEGRDWLARNFPIWPLMIPAAFPMTKYAMYPILWLTQKCFSKPDLNDTSAIQLQWLFLLGCHKLGFKFKSLDEHNKILPKAFGIYYSKNHPFNQLLSSFNN